MIGQKTSCASTRFCPLGPIFRNWDGNTSTARYANVARIGAEFKLASPFVFGGRFRARVAILHSPETRWAFQEQPLTSPQGFAVEPQASGGGGSVALVARSDCASARCR